MIPDSRVDLDFSMNNERLNRSPLYEQLKLLLLELIGSDEFNRGEKFPSERQICSRFDVSRVTANKAVSELVREGILEYRKGIGHFILQVNHIDEQLRDYLSFTNKTLAMGKKPNTKMLDFRKLPYSEIPEKVVTSLALDVNEPITMARRLRLTDNKPVILECHYFRDKLFNRPLEKEEVRLSVYDAITKNHGMTLVKMDEVIQSVIVDGANMIFFKEENPLAAFRMRFIPYIASGDPLYYAEVFYRGDNFMFHNRIGPIQSSKKA